MRARRIVQSLLTFALGFGILTVSCNDPTTTARDLTAPAAAPADTTTPQAAQPENCPAHAEWLPADGGPPPPQTMFQPAKHPNTECPFYAGGWQNFLIATHTDANGDPAIASYATIDDLFLRSKPLPAGALVPVGVHRGTQLRAWLGDIKQAGNRNILIDQDGHSLYYGIHVNQAFVDFVNANGLTTAVAVQNAPENLAFPAGIVEFKTAWKDIDPADGVTGDYSNYITTTAWVATIHQDPTTKQIAEDKDNPRRIKVALVAIHCVYTFPGHPEFVWTSFQHIDTNGVDINALARGAPDTTPTFTRLPNSQDNVDVSTVVSDQDFLLYRHGTQANNANPALTDRSLNFVEATQSFPNQQSSIYRMYAGSKSNNINPDDAVTALNSNMLLMFEQSAPNDKRKNYKLVGGTWMDKPEFFALNKSLQSYDIDSNPLFAVKDVNSERAFAKITQDDERTAVLAQGISPQDDYKTNGSDSPFSLLAGEDRMSSTAMESFTQAPSSFFNCFRCHNTQAITQRGIAVNDEPPPSPGQTIPILLAPKLLNVSHVFSEFILEECGPEGTCH